MSNPDGHMIVDGDPNFNMQDVDESQLEERGEVHFKNGATYTGHWLGNMKHGYGV